MRVHFEPGLRRDRVLRRSLHAARGRGSPERAERKMTECRDPWWIVVGILVLLDAGVGQEARAELLFDARFRSFDVGKYPQSVAIADLNADSRPDLAVANSESNTVSILLGNGDGTFGARTDFGTGDYPRFVAIADLNGDARPDLAVGNSGHQTI